MPDFAILLAPSEGKAQGGNPLAPDMFDLRAAGTFNYFSDLNPERKRLIAALQRQLREHPDQAEGLLGVKGDLLQEAIRANLTLQGAPRLAALERYGPGVLYQALNFQGLPTGAQRRFLEHTIILSGLFGLLRPDDLIPMYRLKMDASLPEIGRVATYWKKHMSDRLNALLAGRIVWNLLPGIHQDAWDDARTYESCITVNFMHVVNGERKSISHGVKALRGKLAAFIVRDEGASLDNLHEWNAPDGFVFDPEATVHQPELKSISVTFVRA